jgi:DNA-binding transcriptional LysR family regulator
MILNERLLHLILTLAGELHFGRAAVILRVSQPSLSGTLKKLESELGVRLFRRTSRHVELTETGHVFITEARRLIDEAERAVALVRGSASEITGPVRIGYSEFVNFPWISSLISFARQDSDLAAQLEFVSSESRSIPEELIKGTLHAAVSTGSPLHSDLKSVQLFREPFEAVLGAGHPLANRASLSLAQLKDEPVVWLRRDINPLQYDGFMALCSSRGYRPNIVQEVRTFYECLEFTRKAPGITFLPAFMRPGHRDESIAFARLPKDMLHLDYTLAYRRSESIHAVERFIRFVLDHVPGQKGRASARWN